VWVRAPLALIGNVLSARCLLAMTRETLLQCWMGWAASVGSARSLHACADGVVLVDGWEWREASMPEILPGSAQERAAHRGTND
jgi:hypothetical protein